MAVKYLRLFDPTQQFQLKGGQLNVAGRLFVHFSDTDDLADVYDENGTQLNQPVILDNNGRAAGLFVDSAKVYWLDVQDQFGMSQFTIRKMTPCGGGGGSQLGNTYDVVSSDGSVAVDKVTEGNNTTFDLTLPDEIARKEWVEENFQPTLTAGANITIVDNVISATGGGGGGALPPSTPADEGKVLTVDEDGLPEWRSLGEDSSYAIANGSIVFTPSQYYTNGRVTLSNIRSNGIDYAYNHDGWVLEKDHVYVIAYNIVASVGYPESGTLIGGRVWLDGFQESDQVWKFALDTSLSHDESLVGTAIVCPQSTSEVHLNIRYDSPALEHIPSAYVNKAEIVDVTAMVSGGGLQPVQSNWAESDSQSLAFIQNKPFVSKVVYSDWQGDFGYDVNIPTLTIDSESHKVSGAGYDLGVMPPYPTTTESGNRALMLSSQSRVPSWQSVYSKSETDTLLVAKQHTLTAGTGIDITDSVVSWDYSVGRNLYLNTNKEIQTDIPGGKLHPTSVAWTEVGSLGAVYKVIARANGTGTYEVGLRYTGSGVSTTYTFIGKSFTTLDSSPSMSFSKIVKVAATLEYSTAFGPAFNPSSMESVTIEGTLILARIYDFRAVMYSDENGNVQVAFTAVEVGH